MTPAEHVDGRKPISDLSRPPGWWVFCLLIVCLKFALLGVDPQPQMFMGDSGSYLWTAFSGWIPPDRSFLYGFVIRWVAFSTGSLQSLLVLQAFLGAAIAISLAYICRRALSLSPGVCYAAGIACALDPLQLVWERYVMTETISLFFYTLMLLCCMFYLRQRRLWQLILLQCLAVVAVSFRISYLLVVQATTIVLPLLAWVPLFWSEELRSTRSRTAGLVGAHLALSVFSMLGLHSGYKQLNGYLAGAPPAYLYSSGFSVLAAWAPVLQPVDSPDPRLAHIIAEGGQFRLRDPRRRNNQLYSDGQLISRWKETEANLARAEQVARQTALHALSHRPFSILRLGVFTFIDYFNRRQIHRQAVRDLGIGDWPKPLEQQLRTRLHYTPPAPAEVRKGSLLQRYFVAAQPYYYVVALCPFLCGALLFFVRETHVLLILTHACIFLATNSLLAVTASVRYLQPLSLLLIFVLALFGNYWLQGPKGDPPRRIV
jgi:hypothetical protein